MLKSDAGRSKAGPVNLKNESSGSVIENDSSEAEECKTCAVVDKKEVLDSGDSVASESDDQCNDALEGEHSGSGLVSLRISWADSLQVWMA